MTPQRLDGVLGAGRIETAAWADQGAQHPLISANQPHQQVLHMPIRRQWTSSSARAARASPGTQRRRTTQSMGGPRPSCVRKDSRTRRLIQLRRAAERQTRFGITNPSRHRETASEAFASETGSTQWTSKKLPLDRGLVASALWKTADSVIRRRRSRPAVTSSPSVAGARSETEAGAALGTAGADDGRTTAAAHANEEAVGTPALDDRGSEGALHSRVLRWVVTTLP
jgi:hypothetical protein